ncbi:flavonoid 3'-monooxygenase-like [Typha angustifolia]|uniref:flavonoid 3'-monooxygenase-like n=1 Tax=Typha angustifolia TaxID=59011 RepID=UPI003C303D9B
MAPLYLLLPLSLLLSTLLLYLFFFPKNKNKNKVQLPLPPGPSGWPILGNLPHLGPKPHQSLCAMSESYGPLLHLRLGRADVVVASSASVAAAFLKTHDANFSSRPMNSGARHMAYNAHDIAWAQYGPRWRALRKVSNLHLFSVKALEAFRLVREGEVARMAAGILGTSKLEGMVELGPLLSACTANTLSRVMLGRRLFTASTAAEEEEVREFKDMAVELTKLAGEFVVGDFVPWLGWADVGGVVKRMKRLARRLDLFIDRIVEDHVGGARTEEQDKDFLSVLLRLKDDEDGMEGGQLTEDEMKAILVDMFVAGTDTSSSTAEWALSELIRHPKILMKAQEELDSVVGRTRLVSEADLPHLPFLHAIVKETFRLHPSTPLSLPRIAGDQCEIDGYHIPKGAILLVNIWAIARNAKSWADPLQFLPERFLSGGKNDGIDVRGNDFELIPFGAGRRVCAGMSLGIRMVQLMTATLVQAFDWALPMGQGPHQLSMEEAYGLTLQRAVPLVVSPKPRLAPHVYVPNS